jgi:SAM-dependent methyltransferase
VSQRPQPERPRPAPRRGTGGPPARRATPPPHERGDDFDRRWDALAARGVDVHGEADLVAALLAERGGRRVLDAGCGTGRVGIELAARGFDVVGVDIDPTMLDAARRKAPALRWVLSDLAQVAPVDLGDPFDAIVLAGNVMVYVGPGSERDVVEAIAAHLAPNGVVVAGFRLDLPGYGLDAYDRDAASAALSLVSRYATWERAPYAGGDYAVSVHARSGDTGGA